MLCKLLAASVAAPPTPHAPPPPASDDQKPADPLEGPVPSLPRRCAMRAGHETTTRAHRQLTARVMAILRRSATNLGPGVAAAAILVAALGVVLTLSPASAQGHGASGGHVAAVRCGQVGSAFGIRTRGVGCRPARRVAGAYLRTDRCRAPRCSVVGYRCSGRAVVDDVIISCRRGRKLVRFNLA